MRQIASFSLAMFLGLTISLMLLPSQAVQAAGATYYVDDDYGNLPPGSGTPTDPFHEIQMGINTGSSGDTVQVAPGTYSENITMKSGLVIQGAGQGVSIIDGGGSGTVVTASGVDSAAKLDGFTITNGVGIAGGMRNENSSPTVTNCTFSGNSAIYGGGIYNSYSSPTVTNCTFSGNSASSGGGMYNSYSSPTVTNCTFSGNSVTYGGGMYNESSSSPTVESCTFSANTADSYGGGMHNTVDSSPTVTNCTFSGNTAANNGGGINNYSSSPTITNCTFSGNTATIGGGIGNYSSSSPTVANSILWGDGPDEIYNSNSSPSVTYSDIQGDYTGTGNINADPMFVDVANGDLHLKPFSPCIDAGDNSAPSLPATDIDGDNRKIDDPKVADTGNGTPPIVDMGADEYVPKEEDFPWELFLPAIIRKK